MIEEQDDEEGSSSAAIEEIVEYDNEDSTAKGSMEGQLIVREEKEEMIYGEKAKIENESDETIREIYEVVESIAEAVFDTVQKGNIDQLEKRSSNTLGMRVKDSLILKVQQEQKKAAPWIGGIRASQLVCHLRQISCEDEKDRFLRSPVRIESPALSSESESLSTRQKKSVSLAENVEVFNRLENELFIENEAGIVRGESMINDRENAAENEDKICGFIAEKSPPASVAESVSFVSVEREEETSIVVPIPVAAKDVEKIEEEISRRDFSRENYSENNLTNNQEIEIEKERNFRLIERRASFSFYTNSSKKSVEILQNNFTPFFSGKTEDVQNLNTTGSDNYSLKLINVEEKTEVKNSSIKSNQSLLPEIVFSQENSAFEIDENFESKVQEAELQLAVEEMDQETFFFEMLASIGYNVKNVDSCTELLTVKSKEGEVNEGRDKLTSDIENGVEQLEPTIGEKENETIIDGNEAKIYPSSLKSSENFGDEDLGTCSLNAVTAMRDSTLLNSKNNSEEKILETEVLIVDHISDDKLKNDYDDDEGVALSDPLDQRFNSESLFNISQEMNAKESYEIRLKKCIGSEDAVVVEKSSYSENATLFEDRDDKSAFKVSEKKFIAAIVEGENLVKFATVSPGQKQEKKSKNFIGKEAAVSREVQMEAGEINDPKQGKSSDYKDPNDRDLGDDFSTENKDDPRSGSGIEKLSRQKSGQVLTGDEKLQNTMIELVKETRSGSTSWKTTLSKVSIKRRKLSEQSSETGKDCTELFESGANSAMELSRRENNGAITSDENVSQAIETLLVIDNDKTLPNTIEEMELFKENEIRKEKCGERDSSKVIIARGKKELKVENERIQDSGFSLQKEKSFFTLREERKKKTDSKSTETCDKIEIESLPAEDNKEIIRNRNRDRKETESVKKFAKSLSRIFSSHSSRKRNVAKGSSSRIEPEKHFKAVEITQASSDDRKTEKKNADTGIEDNGEEFVAVKSLDSLNKTRKTTYYVFLAAAGAKDVEKEFSSEDQEAKEFLPNSTAVKGTKNDPKDRPENSFSQENQPEKKRRKIFSGKGFAKIRKLFSKASTRSENERKHRVQKQSMDEAVDEENELDQKQRTESGAIKQVLDDHKGQKNRSKVPFDDDEEAGVATNEANEMGTNYEQQVSCSESSEDRKYRLFFGVKSTNSGVIDHLERLEMRSSVEKNPPDESGAADSTTPSIEDGSKKTRGKGVGETESMFSRTMKRLFRRRGSAADSISSRPDTCSILSRNDIAVSVIESGKSCTEESIQDEGFAVLDRAVTDCVRVSINREEICANLNNDRENYSHTSESKSTILLLGSKTVKKSFDALTKAFHESSKRSATSSEDDMIETSSAVRNSTRNTFAAAFTTPDNTQEERLTFTRDFDSIPFGRRKSIVVMMATPDPPRRELPPEASSTSDHQQESSSSSSSPTAFYYLLGPTLDEALLDMKAVIQKLIDKITGRGAR